MLCVIFQGELVLFDVGILLVPGRCWTPDDDDDRLLLFGEIDMGLVSRFSYNTTQRAYSFDFFLFTLLWRMKTVVWRVVFAAK